MAGNLGFVRDCAAAAEAGFEPGSDRATACIDSQLRDRKHVFGPALTAAARQEASTARHWAVNAAEEGGLPKSAEQLRTARRSFGTMRLVSLTRSVSPYATPGAKPSRMNRTIEAAVKTMHRSIASLSTRGRDITVAGAGHDIQIDRPGAVIAAIRSVLAKR